MAKDNESYVFKLPSSIGLHCDNHEKIFTVSKKICTTLLSPSKVNKLDVYLTFTSFGIIKIKRWFNVNAVPVKSNHNIIDLSLDTIDNDR